MSHVEPDGLPVDTLAPALRDALSDVSTELVDARHTAHGTLASVSYLSHVVVVEVAIVLGHPVTRDDAERVLADLGGLGVPVLVRGLARANGNGDQGAHERRNGGEDGSHGT